MRFSAVFLSIALLAINFAAYAALPPQSSTPGQQSAPGPHNFGRIFCPQHVPCTFDSSATKSLAANANACVTNYFGYNSPDGVLDDSVLDSNNCFSSKPGTIPKGMGSQLMAQCCVITQADNSCTFRCELNAQ